MVQHRFTETNSGLKRQRVTLNVQPMIFNENAFRALASCCLALGLSAIAQPLYAEINSTTSHAKNNEYGCRIATQDGLKPVPRALDHFRMSSAHLGMADLYGDGTIEVIAGASDETFSQERVAASNHPAWVYEGNLSRSRELHQYAFYSPVAEFEAPKGTRYHLARTFMVQDLNGDGLDDYAVANWGPDYQPFVSQRNEILLSGPDGYRASYLPGPRALYHGGAAGDIDGDGNVDLVIGGSEGDFSGSRIVFYENDGSGNFRTRQIEGIPGLSRRYGANSISLWDLDQDGHLDLIVDGPTHEEAVIVHWGKPGFGFSAERVVVAGGEPFRSDTPPVVRGDLVFDPNAKPQYFSFADTTGNGRDEIIVLSQEGWYQGWRLHAIEFDGRQPIATRLLDGEQAGPYGQWFSRIVPCNLAEDGPPDLIYDHYGQSHFGNLLAGGSGQHRDFSRLDKIVWKNDGSGHFTRYRLEAKEYFDPRYHGLIDAYGDFLGVSTHGYIPEQSYYPNIFDNEERFFHPYYHERRAVVAQAPYNMIDEISALFPELELVDLNAPDHSPTPSVAMTNDPRAVSPRVQAIIDARRKGLTEDTKEPEPTSAPSQAAAPTTAPVILSDRARRILFERNNPNPDTQERQSPGGQSEARINDPRQVSPRVQEIIEQRRRAME